MSPIENILTTPERPPNAAEVLRQKQDRSRDLFGVQLEVTGLLLEAERRKLNVLQKELQVALEEGGSIKAKEHQKQELLVAIVRIQAQYDHLDKEYREHALGALLSVNTRGFGKESQRSGRLNKKWKTYYETNGDNLTESSAQASTSSTDTSDEFKAICTSLTSKLRRMDTEQQIYAEFLMHKVITQGLLKKLHEGVDLVDTTVGKYASRV